MKHHEYPRWKYAVGKSVIVENAEEEAALEGEWFNLPEEVDAHLDEKARKIDEDLRAKRSAKAKDDDLDKQINDLKAGLGDDGQAPGNATPKPEIPVVPFESVAPDFKEDPDELPPIETLRAHATELGIDWHPRTGAKKLSEQIKAAIEAKGE